MSQLLEVVVFYSLGVLRNPLRAPEEKGKARACLGDFCVCVLHSCC